LNHGWSDKSDNEEEQKDNIEVITEVTRKRANSADLDKESEEDQRSSK
jgi:hypothetical protein